jgi:hypothetical protein
VNILMKGGKFLVQSSEYQLLKKKRRKKKAGLL